MGSSYQQAPEYTLSQEATPDLGMARMNLEAPSNTTMRSSTLPMYGGAPGDAQAGGPGELQTTTSFIQRSEFDSRGNQAHDPSAQPRNHQLPSYESLSEDEDLQDVYIAIMGVTGAGKSTFIEKLTGKDVNIGHGLFSCTADVEEYTFVYKARYLVHLIDTPGFDDTRRKDIDVLKEISGWLGNAYINDIKLSGIIYLHRISDVRMTGTARKNLFMFKKLCGPDCFHKVCLVTTMWENVDEATGNMREKALIETEDFWGYMAKNGSQVRRHMNTRGSAMSILRALIKDKLDIVLDIQKELGDGVRLDDTGAGRQLNEEIYKIQEKHKQELADLEKEKQDALRRRDAESVEQIEELQRENAQKLEQMAQDRESIKVDMARILEEREQQLREQEERNARYDQYLREQQEQLNTLKEKQSRGEASPEQTKALEQEVQAMEMQSQIQHKQTKKKRRLIKRSLEWIMKNQEGLTKLAIMGGKIGAAVMRAQ